MNKHDVKQSIADCPDLANLDDATQSFILARAEELQLDPGATLYSEGSGLDDTFCLLLSGDLRVEMGGKRIGAVPKNELFGEMAYFIRDKARSATIRAGSMGAYILKIHLTTAELALPQFVCLKAHLGAQAWDRFVSNTQQSV